MKHYWVKQLAMLKECESGDIESRWGIGAVGSSKVTTNFLIPAKYQNLSDRPENHVMNTEQL